MTQSWNTSLSGLLLQLLGLLLPLPLPRRLVLLLLRALLLQLLPLPLTLLLPHFPAVLCYPLAHITTWCRLLQSQARLLLAWALVDPWFIHSMVTHSMVGSDV